MSDVPPNQIATIKVADYEPHFEVDANGNVIAVDKTPFLKFSRNNSTFRCPCTSVGTLFNTNGKFQQHIKTNKHQSWLEKEAKEREKKILKFANLIFYIEE